MAPRDEVTFGNIADAVDGQVGTFLGTVVACEGELLIAPISGRACVAFDAAVWKLYSEGGGYGAPRRMENHVQGAVIKPELHARSLRARPFVIEDATGRAFVDSRGAYVRLTVDHFQGGRGTKLAQLSLHDPAFLQAHSAVPGDVEIGEGLLEIGELALVRGVVRRDAPGDGALYRVSADARVHVTGAGDTPADITDRRAEIEKAGGVYRLPPVRIPDPGDL